VENNGYGIMDTAELPWRGELLSTLFRRRVGRNLIHIYPLTLVAASQSNEAAWKGLEQTCWREFGFSVQLVRVSFSREWNTVSYLLAPKIPGWLVGWLVREYLPGL